MGIYPPLYRVAMGPLAIVSLMTPLPGMQRVNCLRLLFLADVACLLRRALLIGVLRAGSLSGAATVGSSPWTRLFSGCYEGVRLVSL